MKYKGITLFSAALILMGSVGTATGYIADHPTEVSAAGTDTSGISNLLNGLSSLLDAGTTVKSEVAPKVDAQSTTVSKGNLLKSNSGVNSEQGEIGYNLMKYDSTTGGILTDDDGNELKSIANMFFSKVATITPNSDGSYNVKLVLDYSAMGFTAGPDLLKITDVDGKPASAVTLVDPSVSGNDHMYTFNFDVDTLTDLERNLKADFSMNIGSVPGGKPIPDKERGSETGIFKFDLDGVKAYESSEKDRIAKETAEENTDLKQQISNLESQLDKLNDAKITSDQLNDDLTKQISDLQGQIKELKNEKVSTGEEQDTLTKQISDLQNKLDILNSEKKKVITNNTNLGTKITNLQNQLKDLQNKKDSAIESEISNLQDKFNKLKDDKKDADSAVSTLKTQLSKLKEQLQTAIANANATKPLDVDDETDNDASDKIADEYKVPYVVNKTGTNTASLSSQYFTKTAFVTKNTDGSGYTVEVQMQYQKSFTEDGVKITAVNGKALDQSAVTTTSDDNNYLKSFKFNIDDLSELNSAIPVTMDLNIPNAITATESADLVFDTSKLPITDPKNNSNGQVLGSGNNTGTGTPSTPTNTSTSGATGSSTGTLPQTDAKGLPVYIMYAGFIILAVTLAGAGKVKFTGKK